MCVSVDEALNFKVGVSPEHFILNILRILQVITKLKYVCMFWEITGSNGGCMQITVILLKHVKPLVCSFHPHIRHTPDYSCYHVLFCCFFTF